MTTVNCVLYKIYLVIIKQQPIAILVANVFGHRITYIINERCIGVTLFNGIHTGYINIHIKRIGAYGRNGKSYKS